MSAPLLRLPDEAAAAMTTELKFNKFSNDVGRMLTLFELVADDAV
jgi:hypothetical protein